MILTPTPRHEEGHISSKSEIMSRVVDIFNQNKQEVVSKEEWDQAIRTPTAAKYANAHQLVS